MTLNKTSPEKPGRFNVLAEGHGGFEHFQHRDIYLAFAIGSGSPQSQPITVERKEHERMGSEIALIRMDENLDAIGKVIAGLVIQDVPVRDDEQPVLAAEEETACAGQCAGADVRPYASDSQQHRLDAFRSVQAQRGAPFNSGGKQA